MMNIENCEYKNNAFEKDCLNINPNQISKSERPSQRFNTKNQRDGLAYPLIPLQNLSSYNHESIDDCGSYRKLHNVLS